MRWPLAVLMGVALVGCQATDEAEAQPLQFRLGQAVTLAQGQEATLEGGDLRLRFAEVLEDSRCPTQVDCVWTGQARIAVDVSSGNATDTVEFTLNPAPGLSVTQATAQGYTVAIDALDPYPDNADGIPLEDYRATLSVAASR